MLVILFCYIIGCAYFVQIQKRVHMFYDYALTKQLALGMCVCVRVCVCVCVCVCVYVSTVCITCMPMSKQLIATC